MARVPVITSPCPLRFKRAPQPGMDFCGHCKRQVHNLDLMSDAQRTEFLENCTGEVCVSYAVKRTRPLPLAMGLGLAALAAVPAINAQDFAISAELDSRYDESIENTYLLGGTQAGEKLQWVDEAEAQLPAKADLPDIAASSWLPTPKS